MTLIRYLPLGRGSIVTSPFGPRDDGFHDGTDGGFPGGSGYRPVYAIQSGTVIFAGPAQGYGGPDPAGWVVVESTDAEGGGCLEYGHIIRRCNKGDHIEAGQIIAVINPDSATNGGVAPHLHLSDMPDGYDPAAKQDPMKRLVGAVDPAFGALVPGRAPVVLPPIDLVEEDGVSTKDQVAQLIVGEAKARNHTRDECLAEMSALYQESGWDETIWDSTHVTYGVAQQDGSYPHRFEGAAAQVKAFFDKLDVKRTSPGHGDIWLNICWLQQAPNWPSAQYWWEHGRQAYLSEIKSRIATVTPYLDKYWPANGGTTVPDNRPDFNEYPMWSPNNSGRNGRRVDLFLLHTQEGDGNADSLARFLQGNEVSYHYTISEDYNDHGVTVVDVVDTDAASWSVLSANPRSINLCFAGSRAAWSRADWLKQSRAIDVAAYIAVADCKKYGIPLKVLAPPYTGATATSSGISDHNYVTKVLQDGTHTDVGPNFPWDVFTAAVNKYASGAPVTQPPAPPGDLNMTPEQVKKLLDDVAYIKDQLGPGFDEWGEDGDLGRNKAGQRRTFRAGLAAMMRKLGA